MLFKDYTWYFSLYNITKEAQKKYNLLTTFDICTTFSSILYNTNLAGGLIFSYVHVKFNWSPSLTDKFPSILTLLGAVKNFEKNKVSKVILALENEYHIWKKILTSLKIKLYW